MKPSLVTEDFTDKFNEIIKKFKRDAVLVGVPAEDASREAGEPVNNATLLAINEFGSPVNNIPPRPVMSIGIRAAQDAITAQFKLAAQAALTKGVAALSPAYNRIGLIAATSVKKAINAQQGFPGPSEATLAARESAGFKGTKSLIVTGQLRNSITYVVKGED